MKKIIFCAFLTSVSLVFSQSKKEQIEQLNNRVDSLKSVLSSERNVSAKKISGLENTISQLNQKITGFETQIASLNTQVTKLSVDLQTSKTETATKQMELVAKQQEISNLQTQLQSKTDSLEIVRAELEKLKPAPKPLVVNNSNANSSANTNSTNQVTQTGSYKSVKIGTQTWMAENLNVSTFRNGDPIPQAKTAWEWKEAGRNQQPAWCYYDNDPANGAKYGKLYNWYAVNDLRGLAPVGYHIPSDAEWTKLEDFLGTEVVKKMKSTSGWKEDGNGTNSSGFSGLPGGYRICLGIFDDIGSDGLWWSSTEPNATGFAWYRNLYYGNGNIYRNYLPKNSGFSVRCLRD